MALKPKKKLAILANGGPAPGINSVINAATIEAINLGWEVHGVRHGFRGLCEDTLVQLELDDVAFIHFDGGCVLGMGRTNPRTPGNMERIVETLRRHEIDMLLTIGGDDTVFGAAEVANEMGSGFHTVHIPKTIDNDIPLPDGAPTLGFTTARQVGAELVKNLMKDARTCSRWYIVTSMGRTSGHLAMGIAKAAGANLALIPEEFGEREITLEEIATILEGAVIKSMTRNRPWGVAVLAEGLIARLNPKDLARFPDVTRDEFGHVRLADLSLGSWLCKELQKRMVIRGVQTRFNDISLGYELRCADPVPFDIEYSRDLGYAAIRLLAEGRDREIAAMAQSKRGSLPFEDLLDEESGRPRVRFLDIDSEGYLVGRRYMQRLTKKDFDNANDVMRLADAANTTPESFREHFEWLVAQEPPRFAWEDSVRDTIDF